MNFSVKATISMAACIAACIVIAMMVLGAMDAPSGVRNAGFFAACAAGILLGQVVYKKYVA
jgi:hypothetical protein